MMGVKAVERIPPVSVTSKMVEQIVFGSMMVSRKDVLSFAEACLGVAKSRDSLFIRLS